MKKSVVFSLPNILTYGRIVAVPAVAACYYFDGATPHWIAFGIFVLAAITDFFDGYLARAWQQQSALGRMLDPIADKLLVSVCLLLLAADGTIGQWSMVPAIVILCREILVSGLREFLAELRVSVPVTYLAKWKTTVQLFSISLLLVAPAAEAHLPGTTISGLVALWVAGVLTLHTGYDYFRAGIGHLIDE